MLVFTVCLVCRLKKFALNTVLIYKHTHTQKTYCPVPTPSSCLSSLSVTLSPHFSVVCLCINMWSVPTYVNVSVWVNMCFAMPWEALCVCERERDAMPWEGVCVRVWAFHSFKCSSILRKPSKGINGGVLRMLPSVYLIFLWSTNSVTWLLLLMYYYYYYYYSV